MIHLKTLKALALTTASSPERRPHLSAASGLVRVKNWLYVVADDELHTGVFPLDGDAPGTLVRLFPGELPASKAERKVHKPDIEGLVYLAPFEGFPDGALLALGSGSRPNRRMGALLALNATGAVVGAAIPIDMSTLFRRLEREFPLLNIEGVLVAGDRLVLMQRGSAADPRNVCFHLRLADVLASLVLSRSMGSPELVDARTYQLGEIAGVALCFTDGAALPDGTIVFTAIAEDTVDNYHDGACVGSAIGWIGQDKISCAVVPVQPPFKLEGVHAEIVDDRVHLLLVTDADDERTPGWLLTAEIARPG